MENKRITGFSYVRSNRNESKKVDCRSSEDFPLEVVTLLEVLSRIEARRQAKLCVVRKEVG